uniref:Resistance to inhibitors of cholinesterase protein 3 N-terminal domain-containing protein n=1 Tax=Timema genevievae TaxID=629358 RepID=A0A7R9K0E7_TIMGE|nr:unnamed protein product [Timema genevievae]
MAVEFGTGKTVFILAIVVGCFAVLWPKLFYPMLQASVTTKAPVEVSQGNFPSPGTTARSLAACCDVIFETDVNAIKLVAGLCETVLQRNLPLEGRLSPALLDECRSQVLRCGVDIAMFLQENVRLGKSSRQLLDEIRSFNSSRCLMSNFGVHLGAPRHERLRIFKLPNHFRQERPPHLRPEMLHPALRERGRAIPQSHVVPRVMDKEARPPPIPGMRPPMGGAGHVVPASKTGGTMGIIMPIYTIGIVVFFMYTIMKTIMKVSCYHCLHHYSHTSVVFQMMFKKPSDAGNYGADPQFRKMVFEQESGSPCYKEPPVHKSSQDVSKLGDVEMDQLRRRLEETEAAMERIVAQMGLVPHQVSPSPPMSGLHKSQFS